MGRRLRRFGLGQQGGTAGRQRMHARATLKARNVFVADRCLSIESYRQLSVNFLGLTRKMNDSHESNRAVWNGWAKWWGEEEDKKGIWNRCHRDPTLMLCATEMHFLANMRGKRACVLASGNNMVVFSLAGMGAQVTSVDISEGQLQIARERARSLGLDITFLRCDVTELKALEDDTFDAVHTGGGVDIWISDLWKYYAEAARILKPGGVFIVNDRHPIRRMFGGDPWDELDDYSNRGPFTYTSNEGFKAYEYHWKVADHIQAAIDAGCSLLKVEEHMESPTGRAEGIGGSSQDEKDSAADNTARFPSHLLLVMTKP